MSRQKGILILNNPTTDISISISGEVPIVSSYKVTYKYVMGSTSDEDMYFTINGIEQYVDVYSGSGTYENVTQIRFYNWDDPLDIYENGTLICSQFAGEYTYKLTSDISLTYESTGEYHITKK